MKGSNLTLKVFSGGKIANGEIVERDVERTLSEIFNQT